ncbi:MAG: sigma-70 family RNA polymerase sigma factor [Candidatus Saganbacteria bacterium]|nr:sigma-70 family RNA polymerase sigma factor [Candidatus Saganbacteria bacterium]
MVSRQEVEDRIINTLREQFLKYTDEVLDKYKEKINTLVRWYIGKLPHHIKKGEADDIASEAKIAFIDALKTWDPRKGELWTYVSVRLKGSMQDYLRKRGGDPVAGMQEWISSAAHLYLAFNKQIIYHEKMDDTLHIEYAMEILDDKERAVIDGYYKKDKTFKEIGKEIGLSESQVSRICKESTTKMRMYLKAHPEEKEKH